MNILRRYITKHILSATLIVLLILLGMDLLINFLGEIDDIGQGEYSTSQAIIVAFLRLPKSAYEFFPMAGLIGGLMGLGALASNSELIVMRAAGYSVWQITKAVLIAAFLIMIVVTLIGEFVAPYTIHVANNFKEYIATRGQTVNTLQGVWARDDNTYVYINKVEGSTHLSGLRWFTLDKNHRMIKTGAAASADFQDQHWMLNQVSESYFDKENQVRSTTAAQQEWRTDIKPKVLVLSQIQPSEMSLIKLHNYIRYREQNRLQATNYDLIFWQRLLQPLATLLMMFLAIPFIFGPLRNSTMGLRIVTGVGVGFCFYIINRLFGPFSMVYQLPAELAASIPLIVFCSLGFFLMRRVR